MREVRRSVVVTLLGSMLFVAGAFGAVAVARFWQAPAPILRYDPQQLLASEPVPAAAPAASGSGRRTAQVSEAWLGSAATASGIPLPALRAYAVAALRLAREQPGCELGWTTLAGIGYVESVHGTIGGRQLEANGQSSSPILGPALDGAGDVAAIRATRQSTTWHGDASWDHAVGPLQFIPSTWATWASDGDRDGTADPNDLDDAAYAAGRYLCADQHRLDDQGWGPAIFSYNHSDTYVRSVYDAASAYATRTS